MIPSTHAQIYALHSCSSLPIQGVCDINLFSFCGDIIGSAVHLFHHFHAYFTYFVVSYMYMAAYRFFSSHCHALINMLSWASLSPFFCCLICFLTIGVSLPMLFAHTRFMCILGYHRLPARLVHMPLCDLCKSKSSFPCFTSLYIYCLLLPIWLLPRYTYSYISCYMLFYEWLSSINTYG